jgi:ribosomal protein S18 acetylase RimI-like enzyme
MILPASQHQKDWRQRKAGKQEYRYCINCQKKLKVDSKSLCNRCWLKTSEGKAYNQELVYLSGIKKVDRAAEAKKIASKFSSELGFVNSAALEESLAKNCLEVIPGIGFAHWHHRRDGQTTIYSLAVMPDRQKEGWGRLLLNRVLCSLIEYRNQNPVPTGPSLSIAAKCPEDLASNLFYWAMGFHLEEVQPGKKRALNVWRYSVETPLIFYCGGGGLSPHDGIACEEGWRLGLRSTGRNKAHQHMEMIDCRWDEGYDHKQHLDLIKSQKPLIATVRDITDINQLPVALKQAREIAQYCGRVIIVPKVKCWIPDRYWLGFSVPTSHGRCDLETSWFGDRFVHLLGGNANKQAEYSALLNTVSLDHNAAMQLADWGKAMYQGCSNSGVFVGGGCYNAMRISLQHQKQYWHNREGKDKDVEPKQLSFF